MSSNTEKSNLTKAKDYVVDKAVAAKDYVADTFTPSDHTKLKADNIKESVGVQPTNKTSHQVGAIKEDVVDAFTPSSHTKEHLKDTFTNTISNLSNSSYTFVATAGLNTSRFKIVYQQGILSNQSNGLEENNVVVYKNNTDIVVSSVNNEIENIKVFDITGRLLFNKSGLNKLEYRFNIGTTNEVIIVKTILIDGKTVTKKIIN